ncbi:cardiolipin synthase ClsB [Undibacterium fentianense]|uniref:Cardiolipin synthase B n=1 Tax=Undibacterium fentianense TaxID=2828728 RepID=A0A941E6I8_9BURK|nr:cardiolipin synthase ClsB [Undibacterium fentianense]MBR7799643.1 cardiolipin synthase ClsB [Undibacterium fentianense]
MAKLGFCDGNQLQLLFSGEEYFTHLLTAIDQAQTEIYIETYIYSNDETANRISRALINAARRGVKVQLIVDWIGTGRQHAPLLQEHFQENGVFCRIFNPWFKRGLARTHRKLAVIDHQIGFIGGINIVDDCLADDGSNKPLPFPRWDFAVRFTGTLVPFARKEIYAQWIKLGKLEFLKRLQLAVNLRAKPVLDNPQDALAALVIRDNLRNRNTIQKAYLKALGSARRTATLANPYFAPGRKFRNALINAAQRGVDVQLLLGVGEFDWQDAVAQSYYPRLLASGVKIYEYHKTKLHAKVAVIDDEWATVGSSNFDGLSLFLNHEANLIVLDQDFSRTLNQHLQMGLRDAIQIDPQCVVRQSWLRRSKHRIAFWFYRLLMRLATLGQYR